MRIEVNTVCTKIDISSIFSPFKEMYTWLGRIRDRQLPAEMIIDEEGYGVVLIANKVTKDTIEFSVKGWLRNENTIYLQTIIDHNTLVKSFHNEIVSFIEEQVNKTEPSFIDISGIYALMHISKISQLPVENPQQVFKVGDWVRAIIVYLDVEKYRVALSTKDLETEPGQIFTEPWTVYQNAKMMAKKYRETIININ